MADVLEVDAFANGKWILAFDGRMLEISGNIHVPGGSGVNWTTVADSWRIHVTHLNVDATGPDKKGYHQIAFCSLNHPEFTNGIVTFTKLTDTQWSRFQPLLDALAKAAGAAATDSTSDGLLATKTNALQALLTQHDVHLSSQPDNVRNAVVSDLQAAGVPIDPVSLAMRFTDPGQADAMLEVYQRHGLLPRDASIG
jgi:hypothetical protein